MRHELFSLRRLCWVGARHVHGTDRAGDRSPTTPDPISSSTARLKYHERPSRETQQGRLSSRGGWRGRPVHLFEKSSLPQPIPSRLFLPVLSPDEMAHVFAKVFYGALLGPRRHDVQAAFDRASAVVSTGRSAGNSTGQGGPFILLPRGEKERVHGTKEKKNDGRGGGLFS